MNDWERKFQVMKWGVDVARHSLTEKNRIAALKCVKELIDEMIEESRKIQQEQRSSGLIP